MNNKETTGSLVWRMIYPLLIFIGADIIVEMGIMINFIVPGLRDGTFVDLDSAAITKLAMDYLTKYALYATIIRSVLITPLLMYFMKRDIRYDMALGRHKEYSGYDKRFLLILLPVGIGAAIGFNGLVTLSGVEQYSNTYKELSKVVYNGNIVVEILASAIAAPIVEELVFRGLLYKRIRHHLNATWSIMITAFAFGIIHGNIVQFIYAFFMGIVFAYAYEKFQNIWATIILHCSANLIAVIITELLPQYEKALSMGDVMLISVLSLAVAFLGLFIIDRKVKRKEI